MAITDRTAIQNYMLVDIDDSFLDQITEWIAAVEQEINKMTNRIIIADTTDQVYYYDGTGKTSMMTDDFVSITSIEVLAEQGDDDPTDITEYVYLYPANSTPKWRLEYTYRFPRGRQNIKITGKRGVYTSATVPKDLKTAAAIMVAGIIRYGYDKDTGDTIASESIGRWSVSYKTDQEKADSEVAKATILRYRRPR